LIHQIAPAYPLYYVVAMWVLRTVILVLICSFLAVLGVKFFDALTPAIPARERIKEDPRAIGFFIAGFFIFIGLVIHGALTAPVAIGVSLFESVIELRRLSLIAIAFFVSLLLGVLLFYLTDKLTPQIPFVKIRESPLAIGVNIFGFLIFLGLAIHGALTMPL